MPLHTLSQPDVKSGPECRATAAALLSSCLVCMYKSCLLAPTAGSLFHTACSYPLSGKQGRWRAQNKPGSALLPSASYMRRCTQAFDSSSNGKLWFGCGQVGVIPALQSLQQEKYKHKASLATELILGKAGCISRSFLQSNKRGSESKHELAALGHT